MVRPMLNMAEASALLRDANFTASEIEWCVIAGKPYLLARSASGAKLLAAPAAGSYAALDRFSDELLAAGARLMRSKVESAHPLHSFDTLYESLTSATRS